MNVEDVFFFLMIRRPPRSTLFPYTTLFRSLTALFLRSRRFFQPLCFCHAHQHDVLLSRSIVEQIGAVLTLAVAPDALDRKSTRLNSSHANISYAVFCLKKKIILQLSL